MPLILLVGVYLIYLIRAIYLSFRFPQKDYRYLFVSCYVFSLTIALGWFFLVPSRFGHVVGAFGNGIYIGSTQLIPVFLILLTKDGNKITFSIREKIFFFILLISFVISIFNPNNIVRLGTFTAIYHILSIIFSAYVVAKTLKYTEIIKGFWDGLVIVTILQFILSILWPVLGLISVPTFFGAHDFNHVEGTRLRASGTFIHPNTMGAFMTYTFLFWASCIFTNYRKKQSIYLAIITLIALILTNSRSSMLAVVIATSFVFFIYKYPRTKIFSFQIFFKFILPTVLIIVAMIFLTPLKKYFISENAEDMLSARNMHIFFYLNIIVDHPWTGVGLNTGVAHFSERYNDLSVLPEALSDDGLSFDFISTQPVHNIYVLLLVDVGILGLLLFLYIIFFFFRKSKQYVAREKDNQQLNILPYTSLGCLIAVLVHGFSDHTPMAGVNLAMWLFICLLSYIIIDIQPIKQKEL